MLFQKMSEDSHVDESKLTGLAKHFNSQTNRGRANVSWVLLVITFNLRKILKLAFIKIYFRFPGGESNIRSYWPDYRLFDAKAKKQEVIILPNN